MTLTNTHAAGLRQAAEYARKAAYKHIYEARNESMTARTLARMFEERLNNFAKQLDRMAQEAEANE